MATRKATIYVENQTGLIWKYVDEDIEHGKVTNDPPSTVNNGDTFEIDVQNKDGSTIGPKGNYKWSSATGSGQLVNITLTWNHPFSGATSAYTLVSDPVTAIASYMSPQNPSGHDQTITFTANSSS